MRARVGHGWTTLTNAETYERYIREEVFPSISARNIKGYHGYDLHKRVTETEVEYMTILRFSSMDAVFRSWFNAALEAR